MKTIEKEFTSNGFNFRQIAREGMKAIYHRRKSEKNQDWEVILIQSHDGYKIAGTTIPPGESYPPTSQWGTLGWTYTNEEDARKKFETLKA